MTLFLAHSTGLLSTPTYNSWLVPRLRRIPYSKLPVLLKRANDSTVFRCCANGGLIAEPGDGTGSISAPSGGTTSPLVPTSFGAKSDAWRGEEAAAQTAVEAPWIARTESRIERAIFDFRFLTLMAIAGSLVGSLLCFLKGCGFIYGSYSAYVAILRTGVHTGEVILGLVEAVEVYLVGTVMLIFAMGLFGLFISNDAQSGSCDRAMKNTTLFGLFALTARPPWMQITTLDVMKRKLGDCIVMILIVKLFEKSKTVCIASSVDLLMYSFAIFLAAGALCVLQKLHASQFSNT